MTRRTTCRKTGCGAPVIFAPVWHPDETPRRGATQSLACLDASPRPADDVSATWAVTGVTNLRARALRRGEVPWADEVRYMPHQATCRARPPRRGPQQLTLVPDHTETPPPALDLDQALADLDALIGLDPVKAQILRQVQMMRLARARAAAGMPAPTVTRHLVFTGNPGTGKTTVARLVSRIYRAMGCLTRGHLVEVDRSGLVAGYIGQTALKTSEAIDQALGGVLFIDEAYSLARGPGAHADFGAEAVDTLVKAMEDHREDLVVIAAGYPAPMRELLATNPGLASRFGAVIEFPDYGDAELRDVFAHLCAQADYAPTPACITALLEHLHGLPRGEGFGNGRWARNVFDEAIGRQAWRLRDVAVPTVTQLRELLPEDVR